MAQTQMMRKKKILIMALLNAVGCSLTLKLSKRPFFPLIYPPIHPDGNKENNFLKIYQETGGS